jgi:O-antigen/teichoic acid export membrane protein
MLGSIAGTSSVATYAVASRLADVVAFALAVASSIVAPMIATLYHAGRMEDLQHVLHSAGRWVTLAALVVAVVLVLGPVDFLAFFGDAYIAASTVLMILVIGQLLNAFAGPVGFLLSMTGKQKESAGILLSGVVINAALNLLLIPRYAELGAAVATAATTIYWNVAMTIFASRKLGLRATPV